MSRLYPLSRLKTSVGDGLVFFGEQKRERESFRGFADGWIDFQACTVRASSDGASA